MCFQQLTQDYPHWSQHASLTRKPKERQENSSERVQQSLHSGLPLYSPPQELGIGHLLRDSQIGLRGTKTCPCFFQAVTPSQCSTEMPVQFVMTLSPLFPSMSMPLAVASWITSTPIHHPYQDGGGVGHLQQRTRSLTALRCTNQCVGGRPQQHPSWVGKVQ